ncbi:hypothetical protein CEV32_4965 [Brucella rhizosphaerae]|uniref:Uncharacterized protein n=1 Tax=Brucella rhizosphaerae TaxID=571254 RepID=A0A256FYG1_9HYPH|nr:hypothetical protein CEV32_4965 [Brucella rhizosphaerae]
MAYSVMNIAICCLFGRNLDSYLFSYSGRLIRILFLKGAYSA